MLRPRLGLRLEPQKAGLGLVITGLSLGLMSCGLGLFSLASWPRSF